MLRGLQRDIVETRIIRAHYGIKFKAPWNPKVHESGVHRRKAERNKEWDSIEQTYFCTNLMYWYAKKGDEFTSKKVVKFPFYRSVTSLDNLIFTTVLYSYAGAGEAPYFIDETLREVATLTSDLSEIPPSEFQLVSSNNGDYYKISYDIEMSFEAAISFRLLFKDQVIGEVDVDYGRG